ncbi:hypothetical protein D3C77_587670 [compost metagenome]
MLVMRVEFAKRLLIARDLIALINRPNLVLDSDDEPLVREVEQHIYVSQLPGNLCLGSFEAFQHLNRKCLSTAWQLGERRHVRIPER